MYIKIRNLTKKYGENTVINGLSMETGCGLYRIEGPSGSGKTTLLRIVLGLEDADAGYIQGGMGEMPEEPVPKEGFSRDLGGLSVAAVFQEDRLIEHEDAAGNLRFALGDSFDQTAAANLLSRLGLDIADEKAVKAYSGGMRRRLALARAVLSDADLLALDEPFNALDGDNISKATAVIEEYAKTHIVLLVSHLD